MLQRPRVARLMGEYASGNGGAAVAEWKVFRPTKTTRRRIVCPTLPSSSDSKDRQQERQRSHEGGRLQNESSTCSLPRVVSGSGFRSASPEPSSIRHQPPYNMRHSRSSREIDGLMGAAELPRFEDRPVTLAVRVIYFSRDGQQADAGGVVDLEMTTGTTVEVLLNRVREKVGCGSKGRLLYKGRPLTEPNISIERAGILREPKAVHFMLSRKHRPPEVVERAATVAAELSAAMATAAAEAAMRAPRQKRVVESSSRPSTVGSVVSWGDDG